MACKTVRIGVADATGEDAALIAELLGVCGFLHYEVTRMDSRRSAIEGLTGSHYDCCFISPEASREWMLDCAVHDAMEGHGPEPIAILDPGQVAVGGVESVAHDSMHCAAVIYAISNALRRRRARRMTRMTVLSAIPVLSPSS